MSKNNHRYKDDYLVETDNLDALDELEVPKFEKINHKKKIGKHQGHGKNSETNKEKLD
jgi:hypothetical protein